MEIMGFGEKWCRWIEEYISMAKVLALVNESPTKEFAMKKKRIKVR